MSLARIDDLGDRLLVVNTNASRRGALSPDLYNAIHTACAQAAEPRVLAVLLTAEGGFFCAGGDLNRLRERRTLSEAERQDQIEALHGVIRAIRDCPAPVIAAVEGGAAGAGLSITLACDLIVAGKSAQFSAAYVKAGLVPDGGLTASLARVVPRTLAAELCLLGQPMGAARLHALGVINSVVEDGASFAYAQEFADRLCAGPPEAQATIKRLVGSAYQTDIATQMDHERDAMANALGASEAAEGIAAFFEKRKPSYS